MSEKNNCIITIGRQYGSGGRIIGEKVAKELNIDFYDKDLIKMIADKTGITEELIRKIEQLKASHSIFDAYDHTCHMPMTEKIYQTQDKLVKGIAEKGSCVIVGRCADYILRDNPNCLKVFIHAPIAERIKRVEDEYKPKIVDIEKFVKQLDKDRATYYSYFTSLKWGEKSHYDIVINSSMGIDTCVEVLKAAFNGTCCKNK